MEMVSPQLPMRRRQLLHPPHRSMCMRALAILPLFLLLLNYPGNIVTVNQSDYPWLQPGAYAKYSTFLGDVPQFILSNGTLLQNYGEGCPCWANASLQWTVVSRVEDVAHLHMTYRTQGQERPRNSTVPIPFRYDFTADLKVSVSTGMAYDGVKPLGIVGFWSVPLPSVGQNITFGTAFVDGRPFNVSTHLRQAYLCSMCGLAPTPLVDGQPFVEKLKTFTLADTLFVTPLQGAHLISSGYHDFQPLWPQDTYDYYNGLALIISLSAYPYPESVCRFDDLANATASCGTAVFATGLDSYFRSALASVFLTDTNIGLLPTSSVQNSSAPLTPVLGVAATVLGTGIVIGWYVLRRRSHASEVSGRT